MTTITDISYRRDEVTADKITRAWAAFDAALAEAGVTEAGAADVILGEVVHRMWSGESRGETKTFVLAKTEAWIDQMFDSIGD